MMNSSIIYKEKSDFLINNNLKKYMEISIILSRMFGLIFMVLGLSMLLNKKWTEQAIEEMMKNPGLIWITGFITLTLGAVVVAVNDVWTSGLPLVITILGWLTFFKGAFILVSPEKAGAYYHKMNKVKIFSVGGLIILIIGFLLF